VSFGVAVGFRVARRDQGDQVARFELRVGVVAFELLLKEGGKRDARQDSDDEDDHQQLDEGETPHCLRRDGRGGRGAR
jgi:hypothetical protein